MHKDAFVLGDNLTVSVRINSDVSTGARDRLTPLMAQLFPTNERSFLLPRLTSNCVHVAVPSSRLEHSARLCSLRIVVACHERDIRVYTNDSEGELHLPLRRSLVYITM